MNARKSAKIGILFIVIPALFILIGYLKYKLFFEYHFFSNVQNLMLKLDHTIFFKWISPFVIIILPLLAIIINLLAIMHFYIDKKNKELIITIKYQLKNLIVLIIGVLIIWAVFIYVILENAPFK